jgi:hypothetical protein
LFISRWGRLINLWRRCDFRLLKLFEEFYLWRQILFFHYFSVYLFHLTLTFISYWWYYLLFNICLLIHFN